MNLHHLRYFMALAESCSLHSAARRLKLRQPALSQSIRALEAYVGTPLIERRPTGIRLTPAGTNFLNEITGILAALDRTVQGVRLTVQTTVPLRLGIASDIVPHRLVDVLAAFRGSASETPFLINDGSPTRLLSMLDTGLLDLALLPAAAALLHSGGTTALWDTPLHLALPASHPLSAEPVISLHRLATEPMILGSEQDPGSADQVLLAACHTAGVSPPVRARVCDLGLRLTLVRAGAGIAALSAPHPGMNREGIAVRPVSPALILAVAAAWPAAGLTEAARRFLDLAGPPVNA